jgi:hypothetical protein
LRNSWIDPEEIESLPWKLWAKSNGCWIFADKAPLQIPEKIKVNGGSLRIGEYIYQLRCNGKFVIRFPAKKE